MSNYLQVVTTTDNPDTAADLARSAVGARLAASAQVAGPVHSFFWHLEDQGEGQEWIVTLKTTANQYPALEAHLRTAHPWDNPEISATSLVAGSTDYLDWLRKTVTPD